MTALKEVYKCELCGNMVEVVHAGAGELTCCGQAMTKMAENSTDAAQEKHVPVLEKQADGWKVSVGSVAHPMADDHYIEWIELVDGDNVLRQQLAPGDEPVATFCTGATAVTARAYCNLHGLWVASA